MSDYAWPTEHQMTKDQPLSHYIKKVVFWAACFAVVALDQAQSAVVPFDEPPAWAREAIWYQIFVERFRNGDPSNDPQPEFMQGPIPDMSRLTGR